MGRPLVTACVFCLVCCSHVNCVTHDDNHLDITGKPHLLDNSRSEFVEKVFQTYGNGETMSPKGFQKLLKELKLDNLHLLNLNKLNDTAVSNTSVSHHHETEEHDCLSLDKFFNGDTELTQTAYTQVCPVLLSQLMPIDFQQPLCQHSHSHHNHHTPHKTPNDDITKVWLYSTLSIVIISLCGLLGVAVIPVMQKVFYHQLIQFLVALAVGTLCGDALLHLLPHAMMSEHSHGDDSGNHDHDVNIWRGFTAMLGVVFFYFTEKFFTMIANCRKQKQKTKSLPKVRVMREPEPTSVGEKLCKHKYSSYPYCYGEIADNPDNHQKMDEANESGVVRPIISTPNMNEADLQNKNSNNQTNGAATLEKENEILSEKPILETQDGVVADDRYTVIIREHENAHHGHSHTHGHVHSAPQNMSSVAWMVIMGDGLHNFTDGMAIGAAFSSNIAGGFSTALAVFCHELPHELGDFAVLLKAGMSAKQAVFYNMLSSILCFFGMCAGIILGHDESMSQWVFAAAAGMFLYIALVDMIPELTSSHSKDSSLCQCLLHFAGLMAGISIMLLIAVYEHDLKTLFDK